MAKSKAKVTPELDVLKNKPKTRKELISVYKERFLQLRKGGQKPVDSIKP
jgi:hypothetical protein